MDTEAIVKLTKDLKKCAQTLTLKEAKYLVHAYERMQENRMRADNQVRAMGEKPHEVLSWLSNNSESLEKQIASALAAFVEQDPMGQWLLKVDGIGGIMAAKLLAYLDVNPWKCAKASLEVKPCTPDKPCSPECAHKPVHTAGGFWKFAGLDPSSKWEKGEKRPWNANLKKLCFMIGDSFVKRHNNPASVYGKLYEQRKAYEQAKNESGAYAERAAAVLAKVPKHAQAKTYKSGKLPDGHIHASARRYAVKQFLSDYHAELYRHTFQKDPPLPYPIAILGHAHLRKV